MQNCNLLIVGASFAGLSCAQAAASRGLHTTVIDRKRDPGDSVRTTGIIVKEVADNFELPHRLTRKIHGVRLYSPNLQWVDLVSPGYYFLATDTPNLLRTMAKQAQQVGADLHWGKTYNGIQTDINFQYLVGCDGARSKIAKDFALGQNRSFLLGVEWEFTGVHKIEEARLHVFLDSSLAPGYIAWAVPGVDILQIGLAATYPHQLQIETFVNKLARVFDFSQAQVIAKRGGLIPCGGMVRPWHRNNVCLLGDAAGMVSPLTGGGIHPAMELGRLAGVAISDYLLDSGLHPAHALRSHLPKYTFKNVLRKGYSFMPPPNWLFNSLLSNRSFQKLAQIIFYHHRGLFSWHTWKEILKLHTLR